MSYDPARAHRACMENVFSPRTDARELQDADHTEVCAANLLSASMAMQPTQSSACGTEGDASRAQAPARHTVITRPL